MRRGSGKHQSAGEALGTGSRSVAMLFIFARQSRGILMRALAEAGVHAGGQGNARFAKTVAESVGGRERLPPALTAIHREDRPGQEHHRMMKHALPANALRRPCASYYEITYAPAQKFRYQAAWDQREYARV